MAKVTKFQVYRNLTMAMSRIEHIEDALKVMKSELKSAIDDLNALEVSEERNE